MLRKVILSGHSSFLTNKESYFLCIYFYSSPTSWKHNPQNKDGVKRGVEGRKLKYTAKRDFTFSSKAIQGLEVWETLTLA